MKRFVLLASLAIAISACERVTTVPATQLLVTVSSDLGNEVTGVEAQLYDPSETVEGAKRTFRRSPPFSFAILPAEAAPAPSVLVVLTARDAEGNPLAVTKSVIAFVHNKTVALDLRFILPCRAQLCRQRETCLPTSSGTAECSATPVTAGREIDANAAPGSEFDMIMAPALGNDGGAGSTSPGDIEAGSSMTTVTADASASMGMGGTTGMAGAMMEDGGMVEGGVIPPAAECDASKTCDPGYQCTSGKCVSLCETTRCDPNATCALAAGAPVCTCGKGYLPRTETNGSITCVQDVQCSQLGCDTNAGCIMGADLVRRCSCNPGYMGSGTSCAPISCGPLTVLNGSVNTSGGTFGQTAVYTCDSGYTRTGGTTRKCEVSGWSGTAPTCEPYDCRTPSAPAHGRVTVTNGTRYPSGMVRYSCDTGYHLLGSATDTRTCTATGWSGTAPSCLGCGDGIVTRELNEECELGLFSDPWSCINCKRTNGAYSACSAEGTCTNSWDCSSGAYCTVGGCTSDVQCPPTPPGPVRAVCIVNFACVLEGCTSASQCPSGFTCNSARQCVGPFP